jgi:hypothetical protein
MASAPVFLPAPGSKKKIDCKKKDKRRDCIFQNIKENLHVNLFLIVATYNINEIIIKTVFLRYQTCFNKSYKKSLWKDYHPGSKLYHRRPPLP